MGVLTSLLSSPLINVLIGALIGSGTSYWLSHRQVAAQVEAQALEYLVKRSDRILALLGQMGAMGLAASAEGKVADEQGPTTLGDYERMRDLYLRNAALIDPATREQIQKAYVRASRAHMLYQAYGESEEFKEAVVTLIYKDQDDDDLLKLDRARLFLPMMEFCLDFRATLVHENDILQAVIARRLDILHVWDRYKKEG